MMEGSKMDQWYEVLSLVGEFLTFFLFSYWLLFHKEKCSHCAAREEIDKTIKTIRGENIVGGNEWGG